MKQWYRLQLAVILAGASFAWYTVVVDFMRFFDFHGTVFKFKDCIIPNPATTPCFWGAIGFLVAVVWAIKILKKNTAAQGIAKQSYLIWFLIGGTIFGWTNVVLLVQKFIASQGKPTIGCSGQLMTSPFTTPCFYGSVFYLAALVTALVVYILERARSKKKY